jgi:hypothetical protein
MITKYNHGLIKNRFVTVKPVNSTSMPTPAACFANGANVAMCTAVSLTTAVSWGQFRHQGNALRNPGKFYELYKFVLVI